jgi:hypothetical protein
MLIEGLELSAQRGHVVGPAVVIDLLGDLRPLSCGAQILAAIGGLVEAILGFGQGDVVEHVEGLVLADQDTECLPRPCQRREAA